MRKVLSIILMCGVLVSALAACGSKQNSASNNEVVSSNETGSETNQETEQPKETSFLPPAEHSNHIAPKAEVGQKYNIEKLDFINYENNGGEVSYFDENHIVVDKRKVYDFNGNLLFDNQKIIDAYTEKLSDAIIVGSAQGDYVLVGVSTDKVNTLLYNYKNNSFFDFGNEDIEPSELYAKYIVIRKNDAEKNTAYYSVIDYNNKTIIPFEAGYSFSYIAEEYILASKDMKYFILDLSGNIVSELKNPYQEITSPFSSNLSSDDSFVFSNRNNQITDYAVGGIGHKNEGEQFNTSYSYYLIDKNGKEIHLTDMDESLNNSCKFISQYNGKSYVIEYLDDYYDNENGGKTQKRQLIDENKNVIIQPCISLSGYINGYCRVGEYNEQAKMVTYSLVDLNGNVIESFNYKATLPLSSVSDFSLSLVDEQGFYVIKRFENGSAVYTIKDIAGNVVYNSDKYVDSIKALGSGLFMINGDLNSLTKSALAEASGEDKQKKYIIRITRT